MTNSHNSKLPLIILETVFYRFQKKIFMIIEIESHCGDVLLFGKHRTAFALQQQLAEIEKLYDKANDNFISLLCRNYGWSILPEAEANVADYIYDRDTQKLLSMHS